MLPNSPAEQRQRRSVRCQHLPVHGGEVVAVLDRRHFLLHRPFADEKRNEPLTAPRFENGLQQPCSSAMDLQLLFDPITAERQVSVRIENQCVGLFPIEPTEFLPLVIELTVRAVSEEAILETMTVLYVEPIGHRPVDQQVVVQRNDRVEPLQKLVHAGQQAAHRLVLGMHIANGLDQAVSDMHIGLVRAIVGNSQRLVDVGRLPDQAKDQLEVGCPEKAEQAIHIFCDQTFSLSMLQQRAVPEAGRDCHARTVAQQNRASVVVGCDLHPLLNGMWHFGFLPLVARTALFGWIVAHSGNPFTLRRTPAFWPFADRAFPLDAPSIPFACTGEAAPFPSCPAGPACTSRQGV